MSGRDTLIDVTKPPCTGLELKTHELLLKLMQELSVFVAVSVTVVC